MTPTITQTDREAAKSIEWVRTTIDDQNAIAQAFATHREAENKSQYAHGFNDGMAASKEACRYSDEVFDEIISAQAAEIARVIKALTEIAAPFEDFPPEKHKFLGDAAWRSMATEQQDIARTALKGPGA